MRTTCNKCGGKLIVVDAWRGEEKAIVYTQRYHLDWGYVDGSKVEQKTEELARREKRYGEGEQRKSGHRFVLCESCGINYPNHPRASRGKTSGHQSVTAAEQKWPTLKQRHDASQCEYDGGDGNTKNRQVA